MADFLKIVAENVSEWPEGASHCIFGTQYTNKPDCICFVTHGPPHWDGDEWQIEGGDVSDDCYFLCVVVIENKFGLVRSKEYIVTRAQWEAERARLLLDNQPDRGQEIKELVEIACDNKSQHTFTESDIKAAFEAGANWANGGVKAGAAEYVEKLKGLK